MFDEVSFFMSSSPGGVAGGAAGFGNQVVKRFFGKKDWRVCGLWQSYYIPRQKKFSLLPPVSKH